MDWDERKPVPAPALLQGAIWTYIAGQGIAPAHLTLTRTTKDKNVYVIDGNKEHVEVAATYAAHNPSRKGADGPDSLSSQGGRQLGRRI
jgi:hypothetical protein